jgi:hypothetical protein
MGVAFNSPDSPLTRITAVYRCPCGAAVSETGQHAGELPQDWERVSAEGCICPHCAELRRQGKAAPSGRPS